MPSGSAILVDPFGANLGELFIRQDIIGQARSVSNPDVRKVILESLKQVDSDLRFSALFDRYQNLLDAVAKLAHLPPGWDSYGAEPPSKTSIVNADHALRASFAMRCLPDNIVPSAEGGVALSWRNGDKRAYIEFENEGNGVVATYASSGDPYVLEFNQDQVPAVGKFLARVREFCGK